MGRAIRRLLEKSMIRFDDTIENNESKELNSKDIDKIAPENEIELKDEKKRDPNDQTSGRLAARHVDILCIRLRVCKISMIIQRK